MSKFAKKDWFFSWILWRWSENGIQVPFRWNGDDSSLPLWRGVFGSSPKSNSIYAIHNLELGPLDDWKTSSVNIFGDNEFPQKGWTKTHLVNPRYSSSKSIVTTFDKLDQTNMSKCCFILNKLWFNSKNTWRNNRICMTFWDPHGLFVTNKQKLSCSWRCFHLSMPAVF